MHFCHEPLAREIGQPLPTFTTLNKLTITTKTYYHYYSIFHPIFFWHFCKINVYKSNKLKSIELNWVPFCSLWPCLLQILFSWPPPLFFWPSLFSLDSLHSFILSSLNLYLQMDMMIFAAGLLFQLKSLLWVQSKNLSTFFYK